MKIFKKGNNYKKYLLPTLVIIIIIALLFATYEYSRTYSVDQTYVAVPNKFGGLEVTLNNFDFNDVELSILRVYTSDLNSTSVNIFMDLSSDTYKEVWFKYRELDGGSWITSPQFKGEYDDPHKLVANNIYEYQGFATDSKGNEIKTPILLFKT